MKVTKLHWECWLAMNQCRKSKSANQVKPGSKFYWDIFLLMIHSQLLFLSSACLLPSSLFKFLSSLLALVSVQILQLSKFHNCPQTAVLIWARRRRPSHMDNFLISTSDFVLFTWMALPRVIETFYQCCKIKTWGMNFFQEFYQNDWGEHRKILE